MTKRVLILVWFILLVPSAVVFASASTLINISVSNAEGQALSNVQISLDLYLYEETEVRGAYSDQCTTDAHGKCTILIGETQDLILRGSLDLGAYGSRNVEWHGGVLDLPIRIEQETEPQFNRGIIYVALLFIFIVMGMIVQRRRVRVC